MKYYKFYWDEPRGDEFDVWGTSIFFFEVDDNLYTVRQIEVYENGTVLFYDQTHFSDQYGMLNDQPIDEEEMKIFEITKDEFQSELEQRKPINQ